MSNIIYLETSKNGMIKMLEDWKEEVISGNLTTLVCLGVKKNDNIINSRYVTSDTKYITLIGALEDMKLEIQKEINDV